MNKLFVLLLLFSVSANSLYSQQNCAVILKEAEKMFDNGVIEDVPSLLNDCLKNGFSKDEKLRAYRLIIISFLFDDNKEEAEAFMLELLKLEPEYEVNKVVDPSEFVSLMEKFRTLPLYSFGVFGGTNYSNINPTEFYGVHNVTKRGYDFSSGMGYQFGIRFNRYLINHVELSTEFSINQSTFEYSDSVFSFAVVTFDEKQTKLSLPLSITYQFEINKIKPYIRLGFNNSYNLNVFGTSIRKYIDNSHRDITGSDVELTQYRNRYSASALAAIGTKYKIKRGDLFFEIRYLHGLTNQTKVENRYTSPELIYKYFYIDNDFTLNNLLLSFGYTYSFYKPMLK
ncbi:MAG: PorT family protein [Bacteroidales bacterium]|nr:PorT family protein [Bacteroidales bacterium]